MKIIGLTGGIASGKTTASRFFETLHVPVIDADVIARTLTEHDEKVMHEIVSHFGTSVLDVDSKIDRGALRTLIFNQPDERAWLEALLHPLIRDEILKQCRQLEKAQYAYCVVVIPLLHARNLELYSFLDEIIVIHAGKPKQKERLKQRDNIQDELAEAMMNAQIQDEERFSFATHVVDNGKDVAHLEQQLLAFHQRH